jgi:FtsH-binding integral membrane protein
MAQAAAVAPAVSDVRFGRFLALVYLIMAVGMVVTAFIAQSVSDNPEFIKRTLFNPWFCFGLFMLQIIVVVWLSAMADRMNGGLAFLLFLLYSALTGIALSSIVIYYSQQTIASAFWAAAGMFLLSGLVGFFIKKDLSGLGRFLILALLGYLFALMMSFFMPFAYGFNNAVTFVGIILFAALTAWDTQRLKMIASRIPPDVPIGGIAVNGALALYLDFINLFLLLLRASR